MAAMTGNESTEAQMKADIAAIRDDVALIAGRPARMLKLVAIAAGVVVVGFVLLAAIGSFIGPPQTYGEVYNQAYSECLAGGAGAEVCRRRAYDVEAEHIARDHPEYRRVVGR